MPPKQKAKKKPATVSQDKVDSQQNAPAKKKNSRRDKTTFEQNVTASLYLQQKLPPNNLVVEGALRLFNYANRTVAPYIEHTFFSSWFSGPSDPLANDKPIQTRMAELELDCKSRNETIKQLKEKLGNKELSASKRSSLERKKKRLFAEIDDLYCQKINLVPELIQEHATRRVDLFFYLMIAVYKKGLYFDLDGKKGTDKQHGSGQDSRGTAGCHSSLITNVKSARVVNQRILADGKGLLDAIKNAFQGLSNLPVVDARNFSWQDDEEEHGVNESTTSDDSSSNALNSLFFSATEASKEASKESRKQSEKPEGMGEGDFLEGTYLAELLNEVVELPEIVNNLDSIIERGNGKKTTKAALTILNKVSLGEINPIEGLEEFAMVMHLCFATLEYKYGLYFESTGDSSVSNYPRAFRLARQLEREGTFQAFNQQTLTVSYDYINLYFPFSEILEELPIDNLLTSLFTNQEFLAKLDEKFLEKQTEFLTKEEVWNERRLEDVKKLEEEKEQEALLNHINP